VSRVSTSAGGILYQLQLVTSWGRTSTVWGDDDGGRTFEILPFLGTGRPAELADWIIGMDLGGSRGDGMDMHDVHLHLSSHSVEHRSRGGMQPPSRSTEALVARGGIIASLGEAPGHNHAAKKTGAVGRLVGRCAPIPPRDWADEVRLLHGHGFEHAHALALRAGGFDGLSLASLLAKFWALGGDRGRRAP